MGGARYGVLVMVLGAALLAQAPTRAIAVLPMNVQESRVALVVGNSAYADAPLQNPIRDARAIAGKLAQLGFEVVARENITQRQIGATLRAFRSRLKPGSVALFFYAGHGIQMDGVNYLPCVDAEIATEDDVPTQSLDVAKVLDLMEGSRTRLNLVFLDACRNNPFTRRFRSAGGGLARLSPPSGTILSYATRPGNVAGDGADDHGIYTKYLLQAMDEEGVPIEQALKRVLAGVKRESSGKQEPWIEGGIEGNFYFRPAGAGNEAGDPNAPRAEAPRSGQAYLPAMELAFWDSIKDSRDPKGFKAYLEQYPAGHFASLAVLRLQDVAATQPRPLPATVPAKPAPGAPAKAPEGLKAAAEADVDLGHGIRLALACVPAGSFEMGSRSQVGFPDEKPRHEVRLTRRFWVGKQPVTRAQWQMVMGPGAGSVPADDAPVDRVSWEDSQEFLRRLAQATGLPFRLPTEAEWEYACRAGTDGQRYSNEFIAVGGAATSTITRATLARNTLGLQSMIGGIEEWCQDRFAAYPAVPAVDPLVQTGGGNRVARGITFQQFFSLCTRNNGYAANLRTAYAPSSRRADLGFRVAMPDDGSLRPEPKP